MFKTASKRAIQKTAETTGGLTGESNVNRITKVLRNSQQNNLETVTNEIGKEIPKERHISPEKKTRKYSRTEIKII